METASTTSPGAQALRVLVVDDEAIVRESLRNWFQEDGHEVGCAAGAKDALRLVKESSWDLALLDIKMPGIDGLELQRKIREVAPGTTVIIMTAYASVETAVEALKDGAYDYITKPFDPDRLTHLVRKAGERRSLVEENQRLRQRLATASAPEPILGTSAGIRRAIDLIGTVAPTTTSVLVTGESGTGKELVARAIHAGSPRAYMPMVVVNCGALPEGTLESELFGHERGAFTGAHYRHKGKFELADGGTLFLDEIAEVTPKIQVELLRVLEDKQVTRLGSTKQVTADFRLVAATNKDLMDEVRAGRFREDLYYRINVFHIEVPPLRERKEDIAMLAGALIERAARSMNVAPPVIDPRAMEVMEGYDWPGNVRELANAMERALVVVRRENGKRVLPSHLPINGRSSGSGNGGVAKDGPRSLADVERMHVARVLEETDWNISATARILGVDRTTVYHKIKAYSLSRE
jgi:DNA-binding NtrC family response regulator